MCVSVSCALICRILTWDRLSVPMAVYSGLYTGLPSSTCRKLLSSVRTTPLIVWFCQQCEHPIFFHLCTTAVSRALAYGDRCGSSSP